MPRRKDADEVFCRSCGHAIKREAELCPECGTRNRTTTVNTGGTSSTRRATDDPMEGFAETTGNDDVVDELAPYVAWVGGGMLILAGLSSIGGGGDFLRAFLGGLVVATSGVFALPVVRERLGPHLREAGVPTSRPAIVAIVLFAFVLGVSITPT